jgi:hypothetical protein
LLKQLLLTEPEVSAQPVSQTATGHNPEPVPAATNSLNLFHVLCAQQKTSMAIVLNQYKSMIEGVIMLSSSGNKSWRGLTDIFLDYPGY